MQTTTNYNLPLYDGTDTVDLQTGYNAAMTMLDTILKRIDDEFDPQSTDANLTVSKLSSAKVTAGGTVYIPASTPSNQNNQP